MAAMVCERTTMAASAPKHGRQFGGTPLCPTYTPTGKAPSAQGSPASSLKSASRSVSVPGPECEDSFSDHGSLGDGFSAPGSPAGSSYSDHDVASLPPPTPEESGSPFAHRRSSFELPPQPQQSPSKNLPALHNRNERRGFLSNSAASSPGHALPSSAAMALVLRAKDSLHSSPGTKHTSLASNHSSPGTKHTSLASNHSPPATKHSSLACNHSSPASGGSSPSTLTPSPSTLSSFPSTLSSSAAGSPLGSGALGPRAQGPGEVGPFPAHGTRNGAGGSSGKLAPSLREQVLLRSTSGASADLESSGSDPDTREEEAECLNYSEAETVCADREFDKDLLEGISIVPLPSHLSGPGAPEVVLYAVYFSSNPKTPVLPGDDTVKLLFPEALQAAAQGKLAHAGKAQAGKAQSSKPAVPGFQPFKPMAVESSRQKVQEVASRGTAIATFAAFKSYS